MKNSIIITLLLFTLAAKAQNCNNNLYGNFKVVGKSMYTSFTFDANGKVAIAPFTKIKANYFHRNDSLFVFPDKGILIFKIVNNKTLKGVGKWTKDVLWVNSSGKTVKNNRKNNKKASTRAQLLSSFYDLQKTHSKTSLLVYTKNTVSKYNNLCKRNVVESCMLLLKREEGISNLEKLLKKNTKINTKLVNYAKKAFFLGNYDAYAHLGAYYISINKREQGITYLKKAHKKGNAKAFNMLIDLDLL
ncbi:hypothetical protein RRF68_09510 [Tenacibaculum sp. HL-MS23]|uniref:hypothetical protein n=1 Tax=Tenacibaculum TaxID=104267 RepID=UPI001C4EAB91|nr:MULTISPECIES: hypothetical protein [Tenacibaculum]QXP73182.1 hypothetical protein H0I30_10910 [Tenacibaculum sp. AHE14PA]QXP77095.1 hypothetical protein H0I31_05650 [Tenacibaculum sp. AHE15PA]WNW01230.1 hypothetical protein RRF68_09510 [Tenacibaculum sp. HL-MS23]